MYINPNKYIETEDFIKLIIVYKDQLIETIFDNSFYTIINQYHWRISRKKKKLYVCTGQAKNGGKIIYIQNLIYGFIPDGTREVDHEDGNSLNNKLNNLRLVNRIDNIQNVQVRSDNKTTYIRGISWDKRYSVYTVDFNINNKRIYLKPFKKLEEAVYIRMLCEKHFLQEMRNKSDDNNKYEIINKIEESRKKEIEQYLCYKLNISKLDIVL